MTVSGFAIAHPRFSYLRSSLQKRLNKEEKKENKQVEKALKTSREQEKKEAKAAKVCSWYRRNTFSSPR